MKKSQEPVFSILNPEMVAAVQVTADGVIQRAEGAAEVGAMLHDAGYSAAMLDKTSAVFNEALVAELTAAITYAPRFSAHDRELLANSDAGKTIKKNADKAAIHVARSYIRQTLAAIRRGIETAKINEERGVPARKTLHERLDALIASGIKTIQRDEGKTGAPVEKLLAAFKGCRAEVNALFK